MAKSKSKHAENLIALKCATCSRRNYHTKRNKKLVTRKIELKKFCEWCRKQTKHKEAKLGGK